MIVSNIEIVTVIVVLLFGIPIIRSIYQNNLLMAFNYSNLIEAMNSSLKIQGIISLILIPLTWIWSSANLKYDGILLGITYTYLIVGFFMYLPSLGVLNLVKLLIRRK